MGTDKEITAVPQIIICGSIAIDRIMNFKGRYSEIIQPGKLGVLSISMLLDKLENSNGGAGANIASSLAQLGEKPILIGSVGSDAENYMKDLKARGVDVSKIHYSGLTTASFNVITDSDHNQVGGFYQGAMSDSESVSFNAWAGQNALAVVSVHNPEAMNRQVQECVGQGIRFIYDPGQQVNNDGIDLASGIEAAEILFVNDYELHALCRKLNKTAKELKQNVPILVTTLGGEGSLIEGNKVTGPIRIGIAKTEPNDPTGAGDGYRAGFLYGYLRQWDLKTCGQLGATVSSFIIEKHGTQQLFKSLDVMERYLTNFKEEVKL
jgi:adenosine kinase